AVERRTAIGKGETTIHTVEHLLAAVAAHEIDDLTVELTGPEPPILDGSFQPYFEALAHAGPTETSGEPVILTVPAPFTVTDGDSTYVVAPAKELRLTVTIEWPHPLIGRQSGSYTVTAQAFTAELALARASRTSGASPKMDIGRIMDVLPHRYPFLLVDRIIEVEGQQRIVGIKNVTINEPFFQGHFPGHPIMPGVLIIEAMAHVGGMLLMGYFEGQNVEDKVVYFM